MPWTMNFIPLWISASLTVSLTELAAARKVRVGLPSRALARAPLSTIRVLSPRLVTGRPGDATGGWKRVNSGAMMTSLSYAAPTSVDDAVKLLAGASGLAKVLSGGTDLLVQLRSGRLKPDLIVDTKKIPGIIGIREENGGFVIGAATPGAVVYRPGYRRAPVPARADEEDGPIAWQEVMLSQPRLLSRHVR